MASYGVGIICIGYCCLMMLIILLLLIYKFCCHSSSAHIVLIHRIWTIIYVFTAFSGSMSDVLHVTLQQIKDTSFKIDESSYPMISYYRLSADIFYDSSIIILYIILIVRVHFTFSETEYRLTKCTLISFVFIIMSTALAMISYIIHLILQLFHIHFISSSFFWGLFVVVMINDNIINFTLLILFLSKLKSVTIAQSENDMDEYFMLSDDENNDTNDMVLNLKTSQTKFINVMTKFTVLSGITLICNELGLCYTMIQCIFLLNKPNGYLIGYMYRSIYLLISVVCIYLNFGIHDTIYFKLCNKVHTALYNHYVNKTKRQIKQTIGSYYEL